MSLTAQAEKQKKIRTAELREHFGNRDPQRFEKGQWFKNRAGDVVRIDDLSPQSIWGTLWKQYACGKWVCYGTRSWGRDGRYYHQCGTSLEDLTRRIPKPSWLEGVAA
ncbi:hypothetical protein ABWH92_12205 [Ahrensia marina]|uniref:hypothetical protein n=1 Tax=Ahrensia marina TaxID=1514904 RepID=UPI0035D10700